jgi:hypothetical protein
MTRHSDYRLRRRAAVLIAQQALCERMRDLALAPNPLTRLWACRNGATHQDGRPSTAAPFLSDRPRLS